MSNATTDAGPVYGGYTQSTMFHHFAVKIDYEWWYARYWLDDHTWEIDAREASQVYTKELGQAIMDFVWKIVRMGHMDLFDHVIQNWEVPDAVV